MGGGGNLEGHGCRAFQLLHQLIKCQSSMIPLFMGLLKSNLTERLRTVTVSHNKYYSVFTNRSQALQGMRESTHMTLLSNREWCLPTEMPHPSAITFLNNHHFHIITVG